MPSTPYIVIEGISGSGKTTQVDLLADHLESSNRLVRKIHEPTSWFIDMKNQLAITREDLTSRTLLLLLDRHLKLRPILEDAEDKGEVVIASRSYLSTLVYQAGEGWHDPANIAWLHTCITQPTHLIVLDLSADLALQRIGERGKASTASGEHETLAQLEIHRQRFLALRSIFPYMHIVDATASATEIHQQISSLLEM
jgi:dTMP kinase